LTENPTGKALADLIQNEQEVLAKEVRCLQEKAWKAYRRAGKRKEHRNKTQNTLRQRISSLKAALTETAPLQPKDMIKGATRRAMQGLGFLHIRATFHKLVRQHNKWERGNKQSREANGQGESEAKQTGLEEAENRQPWVVNGHNAHTPDSREACQTIAFYDNFTPEKSRPIKIEPLSIT